MDSLLDHLCRFTVPAPYKYRLETFLESLLTLSVKSPYGSSYFPLSAVIRICLYNITFCVQRAIPSARVASAPLSFLRLISRYWNINQLSIDSASRLRLRSGLTLIRLSLIRNPWSYGVGVSRPHYRYLYLHLRFRDLQQGSRLTFFGSRNAPLPIYLSINSTASATDLCPIIIHAGSLD